MTEVACLEILVSRDDLAESFGTPDERVILLGSDAAISLIFPQEVPIDKLHAIRDAINDALDAADARSSEDV